jgi:hypothetical protein
MDQIELRIIVTEELVHELLWHALAPDTIVITDKLNTALQQQNIQQVPLEEYTLSGISVVAEAGVMYAELSYARQERALQRGEAQDAHAWVNDSRSKDKVRTTSEDSFPASDPPSWTGSEIRGNVSD